jgi:DNA end-binding protein Ku
VRRYFAKRGSAPSGARAKKGEVRSRGRKRAATAHEAKPLEAEQTESGYEVERGKFVVVTDDELAALMPEQSRDIDLSQFVPSDAISPLYVEKSYLLGPSAKSNVAYRLLASTLEEAERVGVATFVMHGRQHLAAIRAEQGILRLDTLLFSEEVRSPKQLGLPKLESASSAKVRSFKSALQSVGKRKFSRDELKDVYWENLQALVAKKKKRGQDWVSEVGTDMPDEPMGKVIDLMEVLQRSLAQNKQGAVGARGKAPGSKPRPRTAGG